MARIIEITEKKREKIVSLAEDAIDAIETMIECFEEAGKMGQRSGMGNRGNDRYGNRNSGMGNRDDWDDDDEDDDGSMGQRRRRRRRG